MMTKKEKLKEFDQLTNWCIDNPIGVLHVARGMYRRLLDDFESRTCENCDYHIVTHDESITWCNNEDCHLVDTIVPPTFGCNKFERRNDGI